MTKPEPGLRPLSSGERVTLARLADKWASMTATRHDIERYQALYNRECSTRAPCDRCATPAPCQSRGCFALERDIERFVSRTARRPQDDEAFDAEDQDAP